MFIFQSSCLEIPRQLSRDTVSQFVYDEAIYLRAPGTIEEWVAVRVFLRT